MKIAREIAEDLFPPIPGREWSEEQKKLREGAVERFEEIIAVRLESVKEALQLAYEHVVPDDQAMPYLQPVRDALALFDG